MNAFLPGSISSLPYASRLLRAHLIFPRHSARVARESSRPALFALAFCQFAAFARASRPGMLCQFAKMAGGRA